MNNLYRIVDVNFNRAREGLRVLEELARFSDRNPVLAKTLRELRHRISLLIECSFPRSRLLVNRYSETDQGRKFRPEKRTGKKDLVLANSFRIAESLRVLEEMVALLKPEATASFQDLRFSFYDLEKRLSVLYRKKLPDHPVYVVIDPEVIPGNLLVFVKSLLDAGAKIFQLRAKKMPDRLFLKLAQEIRLATEKFNACFIVNDRPDITALSDADGLHLGQTDLAAAKARQLCPDVLIGVSVRSVREAEKAVAEQADYVAIGSIFPTATKKDAAVVGLKTLEKVKRVIGRTPLVAIGGITPENSGSVFESGADYAAVISALIARQPEKILKALAKTKKAKINYE